ELSGTYRGPGDEPRARTLAQLEFPLPDPVAKVVPVLDRGNRRRHLRRADLRHGDLRESDVAHLSLTLQIHEDLHLVAEWHLWVDAVELEQVESLHAQSPEAHLGLLAQVRGPPDRRPLTGPRPHKTGPGGNHEVARVG